MFDATPQTSSSLVIGAGPSRPVIGSGRRTAVAAAVCRAPEEMGARGDDESPVARRLRPRSLVPGRSSNRRDGRSGWLSTTGRVTLDPDRRRPGARRLLRCAGCIVHHRGRGAHPAEPIESAEPQPPTLNPARRRRRTTGRAALRSPARTAGMWMRWLRRRARSWSAHVNTPSMLPLALAADRRVRVPRAGGPCPTRADVARQSARAHPDRARGSP